MSIVDKRSEEGKPAPFAGEGHRLESSVPASAVLSGASEGPVELDEASPTTTIQIRLHSGKRIKAKANLTHTVEDLMRIIAANGAGEAPYALMSGYPPVPLADKDATIQQAQLQGASITQKLT